MIKGKALRRAMQTSEGLHRISGDIPAHITGATELISPEVAQKYLDKNKHNRPVNWRRVEQYTVIMEKGEWKLTSQGIDFDSEGILMNGQNRLWAVVYSGVEVYMRVNRGCPADTAKLLDRNVPQSARDLAARDTHEKHSLLEASMARGVIACGGKLSPSVDELGALIAQQQQMAKAIIQSVKGTKKTKAVLMALSVICATAKNLEQATALTKNVEMFADRITTSLAPLSPDKCWGRGAGFLLAMDKAKQVILKGD